MSRPDARTVSLTTVEDGLTRLSMSYEALQAESGAERGVCRVPHQRASRLQRCGGRSGLDAVESIERHLRAEVLGIERQGALEFGLRGGRVT